MRIIVLHDRYSNEPVIIRVDAIIGIQKYIDRVDDTTNEYSCIHTLAGIFNVQEHIDVVMTKIKNAEKAESEG